MTRTTVPTGADVVVRLSSLGDVVLTTGPIAHWATCRNTPCVVVTKQQFAPVFYNHPGVARIVPVSAADLTLTGWLRLCHRLRLAHPGSRLIDLHGSLRTRLLGQLWPEAVKRFPKYTLARRLLQHRLGPTAGYAPLARTSIPQRYSRALHQHPPAAAFLRPQIHLTPSEHDHGAHLAHITGDTPIVALHPYATHPDKAWPTEHWRRLIQLLEKQKVQWRIIGHAKQPLMGQDQRDLTNQTDLRTSAALIAQCAGLVSGDSGPMHIGTAVGTPVVGLFGPTTRHWGFVPSGPHDRILERSLSCRPCSLHGQRPCPHEQRCLRDISPASVWDALRPFV